MRHYRPSISNLAVLLAAKAALNNPFLRSAQIEGWSRSKDAEIVQPRNGEVVVHCANPDIYVAVRREHDKREIPVLERAAAG